MDKNILNLNSSSSLRFFWQNCNLRKAQQTITGHQIIVNAKKMSDSASKYIIIKKDVMRKQKRLVASFMYFTFSEERQRLCSMPLHNNSTVKPAMTNIKVKSN